MQVLEHVATTVEADVQCAPIKNMLRASEKVILQYNGNFSSLTDFVRGKIICDSVDTMQKAIVALASLDRELEGLNEFKVDSSAEPLSSTDFDNNSNFGLHIKILKAKNRVGKLSSVEFS